VGADNRKIYDVHLTAKGHLYAATHFGLYGYDTIRSEWQIFDLKTDIKRFVGIESHGDTLYALSRSFLFSANPKGIHTIFKRHKLGVTPGYQNKVSLFETIWQVHSGEIFGLPGKIFVDFLGILTILLSLTGILYFFFPGIIKRRKKRNKPVKSLIRANKWSLKWHNKAGAWFFAFLLLLFFTGMFLRPPLLIAIANLKLKPLAFTHLDQPNPWYDKFRGILYDNNRKQLMLSTSEGMYFLEKNSLKPRPFKNQPPVSVMGITVFDQYKKGAFIIGSFSGLFLWHPYHSDIYDYARGKVYTGSSGGRPVGYDKVTGIIRDIRGRPYMVDYDKGIVPLWHSGTFPGMPENILQQSKMSLWNLSLEIHTGRIFKSLIGDFYILLVPLSGLISIIVVISGYVIWKRKFSKRNARSAN
jgi:hypothetical protein